LRLIENVGYCISAQVRLLLTTGRAAFRTRGRLLSLKHTHTHTHRATPVRLKAYRHTPHVTAADFYTKTLFPFRSI